MKDLQTAVDRMLRYGINAKAQAKRNYFRKARKNVITLAMSPSSQELRV
jgi:hypothetical protein